MRFGFVCSSGGAVIEAAYHILINCGCDIKFAVVTDRKCGAENICARLGIPFIRIEHADRDEFSAKAAQWLYDLNEVKLTVLFFTRLVGEALYLRAPCINVHPSLLPAFPGFGALKAVLSTGVKFFGATAHLVDHSTDGGPILAQAVAPVREGLTLGNLERISFAQKLYLLLVICELAIEQNTDSRMSPSQGRELNRHKKYANPLLCNSKFEKEFIRFVNEEGIPWP